MHLNYNLLLCYLCTLFSEVVWHCEYETNFDSCCTLGFSLSVFDFTLPLHATNCCMWLIEFVQVAAHLVNCFSTHCVCLSVRPSVCLSFPLCCAVLLAAAKKYATKFYCLPAPLPASSLLPPCALVGR